MNIKCTICNNYINNKITKWSYYCKKCNYWYANLSPNISDDKDYIFTNSGDDKEFLSHLDSVRIENFNKILTYIESKIGLNKTILDVGCATGLFMEMAKEKGHKIIGIEPNPLMYSSALSRNLEVVNGYFPHSLNSDTKFDIIIFNDVFEHIPDVNSILISCREHLSDQGCLIINVPNSDGFIFKIAKMLAKFSLVGLWNRLWQKMFFTPHLHYFNAHSLYLLVRNHKFEVVLEKNELETLSLNGLWKRVNVDNTNSLIKSMFIFLGTVLLYPLIMRMPRDNFFAVYSK